MKTRETIFQVKEQDKTWKKTFNEMEIIYLVVFKVMVIKMFTKLRRRTDDNCENLEVENIRKYKIEVTEQRTTVLN